MRRGLLKDLGNTPTQMACGWRLYGALPQLRRMDGSQVVIDLLAGSTTVDGEPLKRPLEIAQAVHAWMNDRRAKDDVPSDTLLRATLVLRPRVESAAVVVACSTCIEAGDGIYTSEDTARWVAGDAQGRD
jgi:hypothetical protein